MQPLFKLPPGHYWSQAWGTWPYIVPTRRLEHKWETWTGVSFIWPRLQRPGEGPLFESDTNKRRWVKMRLLFKLSHRQLLKSSLGPDIALIRCMTVKFSETTSSGEQKYFHITQDWNCLGRGHYSSQTQINAKGLKCSHSSSYPLNHY